MNTNVRFNRRVKLSEHVTVNLSKSGASLTLGVPGLSINLGKRGTYLNMGLPGTGLSTRTKLDTLHRNAQRNNDVRRLVQRSEELSNSETE
jgi:hypothetical protein